MTGGHPALSNQIPHQSRAKQLSEDYKQRTIERNDARDTDTWVMWQAKHCKHEKRLLRPEAHHQQKL